MIRWDDHTPTRRDPPDWFLRIWWHLLNLFRGRK